MIGKHFDKIYVLNLKKREERLALMQKRLAFTEITNTLLFEATDGSVMDKVWESFSKENSFFQNASYLACAISHLSIYQHALEKGYNNILVVEDDVKIHRETNILFEQFLTQIPSYDLLYLGFIPLTDDCSMWNYNLLVDFVGKNVVRAKNLWGLYSYAISQKLMRETLETYKKEFPMELDRFFVTKIQTRGNSYGIIPQLFAADDGYSDNSKRNETCMLERSIDSRFAKLIDYI